MCSPLDPMSCTSLIGPDTIRVASAGGGVLDVFLAVVNDQLHAGIKQLAIVLAGWLLVPSTQLCPGADQAGTTWVDGCNTAASPATQLRAWMLPVTVLVAVLGLLWQAIMLTVTRKGEPLLIAIRGLATTALWGAVGIVGTQLALRASDSYSLWILQQAVIGDSPDPVDTLGTALANMSVLESYNTLVVLLGFSIPIFLITLGQIILMIFREGSVVILAGVVQLAAAGSFTRLTSAWLPRVTGWMLALIAYKAIAASVYATAFALMGNDGLRNSIMGLAVMILALVAMPATMKFFNWTVGSLAGGSSTLGMLGTAAAAGVHAASSLRGIGGYRPGEHATYMDEHGPGSGGGGSPSGGPTGSGPTGAAGMSFVESSGASSTANVTASGSAAAGGAAAATGAATGGATLAADAAMEVGRRGKQAAEQAAAAADDAMQGQ